VEPAVLVLLDRFSHGLLGLFFCSASNTLDTFALAVYGAEVETIIPSVSAFTQ